MIQSNMISVVISGPVFESENSSEEGYTKRACKKVREMLPDAELIISTWEGTDCSNLDYDILVLNHDPGHNEGNVNRQIVSRIGGIKRSTREYILAIRSESEICRLDFMNYLDKYELHGKDFCFLKHRIVIPATAPARRCQLFHMGDWYYFGHRSDMIELWDLPLMKDELFNNDKDDILYNPHRYLITAFIRKYYPLCFKKNKDITEENCVIYEKVIAENFINTGFYEFGIFSLKYPSDGSFTDRLFHKEVDYTFNEWKELYNKYCGGNEIIHKTFEEIFMVKICVPIKKSFPVKVIRKVLRHITNKNKST